MGYAYAFVDNTSAAFSTLESRGRASDSRFQQLSAGSYTVTFPNSGIGAGWSVMVSASEVAGISCAPANWANSSVTVYCLNASGVAAQNIAFEILAISNTNGSDIAFANYGATQSSYNPAGTVTMDHVSTGFFTVTFNGLNGNGGTVQVTSQLILLPTVCYSDGWGGSPFTAIVLCTDNNGNPNDAGFNIAVIPAGATPPGIDYALADQATSPHYDADAKFTYDPSGPVPVQRLATGQYEVSFPGGGTISGGPISVTSQGGAKGEATQCSLGNGIPSQLFVYCYNFAGQPADSLFQVLTVAAVAGPPASLSLSAGSPQSAPVTTPFGTAMSVLVLDANNNPVPNVPVLFTAPSSGPSGTFPGASQTATVVSNASGVAAAPTFTANTTAGGPYTVSASFIGAASASFSLTNTQTGVQIESTPVSVGINFDGTAYTTPFAIYLDAGSSHTMATSSPQAGATGVQYTWLSWSDGGAISHNVTIPESAITYTAYFQTQFLLTSSSSPAGSGTVTPGNGSYFAAGTAVPVAATANPGYVFSNWSGPVANANSASTTVTMNGPETVTAKFSPAAGITIQTSPEGLPFTLGGTTYTAPQTINLSPGMYTIAVLATQAGASGTRYAWMNWSDGGTLSHTITVSAAPATYTANFQTEYLLTASAVPANAGSVSPSNSYFAAGSNTTVTASSQLPYIFSYWSGAASGTASAVSVAMNGTESVTANFVSCDLNNDGVVDVRDLQILINQALGVAAPVTDLNHDGVVNAIDIQRLIALILSD